MKINKLYEYPKSMRSVINGGRHYDIDGDKLPSVTTILSACQTDEKRASLAAWKARVGPKQADEIRDKAAERGTAMHTYLEHHISGSGHKDLTVVGQHAEKMAKNYYRTRARGPGRSLGFGNYFVLPGPIRRSNGYCWGV
jgi:hypothetical protein